MQFLLRAKHWQIFLPYIAVYLISMGVMFSAILRFVSDPVYGDIEWLLSRMQLSIWFIILLVLIHYFWMLAVGLNLHKLLPAEQRTSKKTFLLLFILNLSITVSVLVGAIFIYQWVGWKLGNNQGTFNNPQGFSIAIVLVSICGFIISILLYAQLARILNNLEKGRVTSWSENIVEVILLWFFPVGIWFLQPRINKLVKGDAGPPPLLGEFV